MKWNVAMLVLSIQFLPTSSGKSDCCCQPHIGSGIHNPRISEEHCQFSNIIVMNAYKMDDSITPWILTSICCNSIQMNIIINILKSLYPVD